MADAAVASLDPVFICFSLLGGGLGFFIGDKVRQNFPTATAAPGWFCRGRGRPPPNRSTPTTRARRFRSRHARLR